MIDGATIHGLPEGYRIERIYLIHCEECNEEITRAQLGRDIEYLTEARKEVREHEAEHKRDRDKPGSVHAEDLKQRQF